MTDYKKVFIDTVPYICYNHFGDDEEMRIFHEDIDYRCTGRRYG